jgi:hypothetical protein
MDTLKRSLLSPVTSSVLTALHVAPLVGLLRNVARRRVGVHVRGYFFHGCVKCSGLTFLLLLMAVP